MKLELLPNPFFSFTFVGDGDRFLGVLRAVTWQQNSFSRIEQFTLCIEHLDQDGILLRILDGEVSSEAASRKDPESHLEILAQGGADLNELFRAGRVLDFQCDDPVGLAVSGASSLQFFASTVDEGGSAMVIFLVVFVSDDPVGGGPCFIEDLESDTTFIGGK